MHGGNLLTLHPIVLFRPATKRAGKQQHVLSPATKREATKRAKSTKRAVSSARFVAGDKTCRATKRAVTVLHSINFYHQAIT